MLKVLGIGNLGKDATTNQVNGKQVINFSIASTDTWKDAKGEKQEKTTWLECSYWTDNSGIVPYLKKGTQVFVEGNADLRTYQTQDGKSGASITCRVMNVKLLGSPSGAQNGSTAQPVAQQTSVPPAQQTAGSGATYDPKDDLPF